MTPDRPRSAEYDPYYGLYIDQAPAGDILAVLESELATTRQLLANVSGAAATTPYAAGKWSLRQLVGHLIDTEWTFTYRGLCMARTDPAERPGFDQDLWARVSNAGDRPLDELLDDFACARRASLSVYRSFTAREWLRRGVANGCTFSVRAMPYILAGHEVHHRKVIVERYLTPAEDH